MRHRLSIFCFILIIISSVNCVFAVDKFTISVSCIIPAVPGVNAPLQVPLEDNPSQEAVKQEKKADEEQPFLTQITKSEDKICYTTYSR